MNANDPRLQLLATLIESETRKRLQRLYPSTSDILQAEDSMVKILPGKKYIKVDVGRSGKYMVDAATEEIFGIKAYGVIHRGHRYGTLDTIDDWFGEDMSLNPSQRRGNNP